MDGIIKFPKPVRTKAKKTDKKKPKVKKYSLSTERREALHEFQRYQVESRASVNGYAKCITSGLVDHYTKLQGGHYITRNCRATELDPDNVWPQCATDNMYGKGEPVLYRRNLIDLIGLERVERLEDMYRASKGDEGALRRLSPEDQDKVTHKKTALEYHEIRLEYKAKRRELRKQRGWV